MFFCTFVVYLWCICGISNMLAQVSCFTPRTSCLSVIVGRKMMKVAALAILLGLCGASSISPVTRVVQLLKALRKIFIWKCPIGVGLKVLVKNMAGR